MIINSYQSKAGLHFNNARRLKDLVKLEYPTKGMSDLEAVLKETTDDIGVIGFVSCKILPILPIPEHDHIELFPHPILMERNASDAVIAVDLRAYCKEDPTDPERLRVTDRTWLTLEVTRALLEVKWQDGKFRDQVLWRGQKMMSRVFSMWINSKLSSARQLTETEVVTCRIVTEAYWMDLHSDEPIDQEERVAKVSRNTRLSPSLVAPILEAFPYIGDLEAFLLALKTSTQSLRLESVNVNVLAQILNDAWYGPNGRPLSYMATEFPPAYMSMMLTMSMIGETWFMRSAGLGRSIKSMGRDVERELSDLAPAYRDLLNL